jgi:ribosomal subunit interface protein
MKIDLSGHHVEITESMKAIVDRKFQKYGKRYARLSAIQVIVKVESNAQHIEVKTSFMSQVFSVSATDKDFYKAVDQAATKLSSALETRKSQSDPKGREKPAVTELDESEPELEEY